MATAAVNDLWGDGIAVTVRSPLSILREQANLLEKKTHGILCALIETVTKDKIAKHNLLIDAPSLKYSLVILWARHKVDVVYPVELQSDAFQEMPNSDGPTRLANCESEFYEFLRFALQSDYVRSTLHGLIAKSNEDTETTTNGDDNA